MSKICIFTIISKNYVHYARTLFENLRLHAPEAEFLVGLCDRINGFDWSDEPYSVLEIEKLPIANINKFIFRYTVLELNTAVKPYIFSYLFAQGFNKVIYFDPDIRVYDSLNGMQSLLDDYQMLLTPHLLAPISDDKLPSELNILVSGTYNLGYIGLRNTHDMKCFLDWWQTKLYTDCVVDIKNGLFVDQKWMDLVPGMYDGIYISRDPGWNTAYWNLNHRKLSLEDGMYTVNGSPLTFFHFSGFSTESTNLSKHQNRFTRANAGQTVETLCLQYAERLIANGQSTTSQLPYAFGRFADGTQIPDFARYIYRDDYDWEDSDYLPYHSEGDADFMGYLNEAIMINGKAVPYVTRLALKLYQARIDLQTAFPDLSGVNGKRFADWYAHNAQEQAGFAACFITPVANTLNHLGYGAQYDSRIEKFSNAINRKVYRFLRNNRHLFRPFTNFSICQRLYTSLLESIDPVSGSPANIEKNGEIPNLEFGINLIGYIYAESGVGQSARSDIESIVSANVPLSVIDYRKGNASRMEARVPKQLFGSPNYNINLFHINADEIEKAISHLGKDLLLGRYNIGYWAWELESFPDVWLPAMSLLDEIWVPSRFCQEAITRSSCIPVIRVPHSINMDIEWIPKNRIDFGLPSNTTLLLTVFDALSFPERKNPLSTVRAFLEASNFEGEDIHLAIKVSNLDKQPRFAAKLRKIIEDQQNITLIDEYFTRENIDSLISVCDIFISLHRSEGFGLCLAEAMALGKPVIGTGWSGNMDFMNVTNSIPIDYTLVVLEEDNGPYKEGQYWAEPDHDAAVEAICNLISSPELRRDLGVAARSTIRDTLSSDVVGRIIERRLQELVTQGAFQVVPS